MLSREKNQLFFDKIPMKELAERYGTPSFIYSEEKIIKNLDYAVLSLWCLFKKSTAKHTKINLISGYLYSPSCPDVRIGVDRTGST